MKDPANVAQLAALQPDYMGFIYYAKSPRFAGNSDEAVDSVPGAIGKTAVFVNESAEKIEVLINQHSFEAVQLHGNESPEFCSYFKEKVQVWKAFGVDDDFDFNLLNAYADKVDYFLFDTKTNAHGGSGQTFNWQVLDNYQLEVPFFLSGGLSAGNIGSVTTIKHPQFYGVDLNSRFEIEPGIKDMVKLKQAFNILRTTDEVRS